MSTFEEMKFRAKRRMAIWLRGWAERLSPAPTAKVSDNGRGWDVEFRGVRLAHVNLGEVRDLR